MIANVIWAVATIGTLGALFASVSGAFIILLPVAIPIFVVVVLWFFLNGVVVSPREPFFHWIRRATRKYWYLLIIGLVIGFVGGQGTVVYAAEQSKVPASTLKPNSGGFADICVASAPSGWMGDGEYGTKYLSVTQPIGYTKVTYAPGPKQWGGVYWQHPDGNWGDKPGYKVFWAKTLSFSARGENGSEVVELKQGESPTSQNLTATPSMFRWGEYNCLKIGRNMRSIFLARTLECYRGIRCGSSKGLKSSRSDLFHQGSAFHTIAAFPCG